MNNTAQFNPDNLTSDERMLSMLSYLSVLFGGIFVPLIIWIMQKDKSKYVSFHSLQAIFFHIAYIAVLIILIVVVMAAAVIIGLGTSAFLITLGDGGHESFPFFMVAGIFLFYALLFGAIFGFMGYGIYLAVKSYGGNLNMVPFIGKRVYRAVFGRELTRF